MHLDNDVRTTKREARIGSVETLVPFFVVCGPKFTKLNAHAHVQERFATPSSVRRYLVLFWIHSFDFVQNWAQNFDVWDAIYLKTESKNSSQGAQVFFDNI